MLGIISLPQHCVPKETGSRTLMQNVLQSGLGNTPKGVCKGGRDQTEEQDCGLVATETPADPMGVGVGGRHGTWVALQGPSQWRPVGWDFAPPPGPVVACGVPQSGVKTSGEVAAFGRGRCLKTGCALHWGNRG